MKTHTRFVLVLAAIILASALFPLSAAAQSTLAKVHPVKFVERLGVAVVGRGTSMSDVLQSLGRPHDKLSAVVWAYPHFNGGEAQSRNDDCSTLLITFSEGRVSDIKLINDRAQIVYAARLRARSSDPLQLATK